MNKTFVYLFTIYCVVEFKITLTNNKIFIPSATWLASTTFFLSVPYGRWCFELCASIYILHNPWHDENNIIHQQPQNFLMLYFNFLCRGISCNCLLWSNFLEREKKMWILFHDLTNKLLWNVHLIFVSMDNFFIPKLGGFYSHSYL